MNHPIAGTAAALDIPNQARTAADAGVYRSLLESTNAIPWRIDWRSKRFSYIGPQIEQLLGWKQDSWIDVQDWAERMHPDDRNWVVPFCVSQSEAGVDHEADYRASTADGSYIWIRDVVRVVRNGANEVEYLIGFMFDISHRKKTEEQLAALQENLENLVDERTRQLQLEIEKRQRLERELFEIAEAERRRIGRELHDDLGQRLTGISLLAQAMANSAAKGAPELAAGATTIERSASEAISQVRNLAHGLMPAGVDAEGFRSALVQLANDTTSAQTRCCFEFDEPVDVKSPDVATNLFRIAQEAVSNALRHACAASIVIRLDLVDGRMALSVTDDGIGGAVIGDGNGDVRRGRGLGIMEYRASLIGFQFGIASRPRQGTSITVTEC